MFTRSNSHLGAPQPRWVARAAAVLTLVALGVAPAALPAYADGTGNAPASTSAAMLTALSQADALVVAARQAVGLPAPAGVPAPDPKTLSGDAQGLASWLRGLPAADGVPGPASALEDDIAIALNDAGNLGNGVTVPDPGPFLTAAEALADDARVIGQYGLPPVDVPSLTDQLASVETFLTIKAGQLASEAESVLANLPTTQDLLTTVEQEEAQILENARVIGQIGLPPGIADPQTYIDELASLETLVAEQAAQLTGDAQNLLSGLPTPQGIADAVLQEVDQLLTQQSPLPDLSATLLQADQEWLWLGQQVSGPLNIVGPTVEQALNDAGAVNDAIDTLLATDPGVSPPPPVQVPGDSVVAVSVGPGHVMRQAPDISGLTGLDVGATSDSVQDTASTVTGYRCYMRGNDTCAPPLTWHGGKVQHNPKVYVIFWGPKWASHASDENTVNNMYQSLSGSGIQAVLSQYHDMTSTISTAMTYGGGFADTSTPPAALTETQYVNEAISVARAHGLGTSDDTQWVFYPQPGVISTDHGEADHCGYHDHGPDNTGRNWIVDVIDYPTGFYSGCTAQPNAKNVTDALTAAGSHEYAEAATNPFGDAWRDNNGWEIGDMCDSAPLVGGLQPEWSNDGSIGHCASSFTPRYTYQVTSVLAPQGEPSGVYARGHAYDGGHVIVTNTGNMPWFPVGRNATYLGTWNTASRCSHSADMNVRDVSNFWKSCTRIRMGGNFTYPVEPRAYARYASSATFPIRVKPDGFLGDGKHIDETFNLVSSVWMTPSSGSMPTVKVNTAVYNGKYVLPASGGPIVAGLSGTDVAVRLDYNVTGTAPWYQNEAVYLGTSGPNGTNHGHQSRFAASTWPKSGVCGGCRASRVTATTQPTTGVYSFTFTVHIPFEMQTGTQTEWFQPVADVPINSGGISSAYFGTAVPVTIVVVGTPVGSHQLTADGTIGSEPASGYDTTDPTAPDAYGHWFLCVAAATADAGSTTVDSCSLTVTHPDGSTSLFEAASPQSRRGGLADSEGIATYDATTGDTAQLCWQAHGTYLDGSTQSTWGCSG